MLMASSNPKYLQKTLLPNTTTLGGRVSTYKFWGDTAFSIVHDSVGWLWFFLSGLVWLGLDGLGRPHSYIRGLIWNPGTAGMAGASFHVVLLILTEAGMDLFTGRQKGSPEQEPLFVSYLLLCHWPKVT